MRMVIAVFLAAFLGGSAFGESIDPSATQLPWVNGPERNSIYNAGEPGNKVHVWESFTISCPYCHRNADAVKDLASDYEDLAQDDAKYGRVQFLDLCLNGSANDCRSWVNQHRPDYPVVHDADRYVWDSLNQANSIPQTLVTDCNGNLVDYTIGQWDSRAKNKIKAAIERALETECEVSEG